MILSRLYRQDIFFSNISIAFSTSVVSLEKLAGNQYILCGMAIRFSFFVSFFFLCCCRLWRYVFSDNNNIHSLLNDNTFFLLFSIILHFIYVSLQRAKRLGIWKTIYSVQEIYYFFFHKFSYHVQYNLLLRNAMSEFKYLFQNFTPKNFWNNLFVLWKM